MKGIGTFGGKVHNLLEDYKKPKVNLLEEFKECMDGKVPSEDVLVPLLNWYSNHITNIRAMQSFNQHFFWADKRVLARYMCLNLNRRVKFIKYPKKKKDEHELAFLIPYVQRLYGWSEREWKMYEKLVNLEDRELHQILNKKFALDKKELKKLGITNVKIKAKYEGKPKVQGFF